MSSVRGSSSYSNMAYELSCLLPLSNPDEERTFPWELARSSVLGPVLFTFLVQNPMSDSDGNSSNSDVNDDDKIDGTSPTTRRRPFILLTGTPGVGKTATASLLAEKTGFEHVCVGEIVREHKFYDGHDDQLDSYLLDEEKLLDHLEVLFKEYQETSTGIICDYHACELFPERWFDLVLVLRTSTEVLFDRLTKRGYSQHKREQNMECEIMQILLEEAKENYAPEIVHEVKSDTIHEMNENVERVQAWIQQWILDQDMRLNNTE